MKKWLFLAAAAVLFLVRPALAHPPTKIDISYNAADKVVKAVITHPVQDPTNHYIGKVDVFLNGKEIISQEITRQDNQETQTVEYRLPDAKSGDIVGVEGHCNRYGERKEEITLP